MNNIDHHLDDLAAHAKAATTGVLEASKQAADKALKVSEPVVRTSREVAREAFDRIRAADAAAHKFD